MNKSTNYFGVDISKDSFDVMEATGYYYVRLAYYLVDHNIRVSVENPVSVKRFIQMKLSKIKPDKSDAKMICLYAQQVDLKLWMGHSENQIACFQLMSLLNVYSKQSSALKNKLHGENTLGNPSSEVVKSIKRSLHQNKKEQEKLEKQLTELIKESHSGLLTLLESIPGLGRKTASRHANLGDRLR